MSNLPLRFIFMVAFFASAYGIYLFNTRDTNSPELVGMLNEVVCYDKPINEDHAKRNRALVEYDDYALYFVCLSKEKTENKQYLKCDNDLNPPICGNSITITQNYSLTDNNKIINASQYAANMPPVISSVSYMFSQNGFKPLKEPHKEQYKFAKKDLIYADKFNFKTDIICDSQASSLNQAMCIGILAYNSVDIQMVVYLKGQKGTKFSEYDVKNNIQQWLKLLNDIVQPIKK